MSDKATFDSTTNLSNAIFGDQKSSIAQFTDVHWGDTNLAVIDWTLIKKLGDEQKAEKTTNDKGHKKAREERYEEYKIALRANRQLAVVLRNQGLNEEADHFAYHAQCIKRNLLLQEIYLPKTGFCDA